MLEQVVLVLAFAGFLAVGLCFERGKRATGLREFALSTRGKKWFAISAGVSMSYAGGASTLNMASLGYQYGWWPLISPMAVVAGLLVVALLIDRYRAGQHVTIADMLAGANRRLSLFIGLITAAVYIMLVAAQFVAMAKLAAQYFPDVTTGALIFLPSALVFLYVFISGFSSVSKTDIMQYLVIAVFLVVPVFLFVASGGNLGDMAETGRNTEIMPLDLAILLAFPLLYVPVSPDIAIRTRAAVDRNHALAGLLAGGLSYFLVLATAIYIGIALANNGIVLDDTEAALPWFFEMAFPHLGIMAMVAVLAAIISSMDSFALSAIVVLANDVLGKSGGSAGRSETTLLRLAGLIAYLCALAIALYFNEILTLILSALLIYVSTLIPMAIGRKLGLGDKSLLAGGVTTIGAILAARYLSVELFPESVIYPALHLSIVCVLYLMTGSRSRTGGRR